MRNPLPTKHVNLYVAITKYINGQGRGTPRIVNSDQTQRNCLNFVQRSVRFSNEGLKECRLLRSTPANKIWISGRGHYWLKIYWIPRKICKYLKHQSIEKVKQKGK